MAVPLTYSENQSVSSSELHTEQNFKWFSKKWDENFIVLLPILNALASILTNYFSSNLVNPGQLRVFIILLFGAFFLIKKFPHTHVVAKLVLLYILFLLYLTVISTHFSTSFNVFLKMLVSYLLLFFGIYYARNPDMIKRVSVSILVMLGIFIINFIISNIFGLGETSYKGVENQLNFGASGVNLSKQVTPILLMMPIMYKLFVDPNNKKIIYMLILGGIIFVLFAFKRTPLFGLALGYLIIGLVLPNKSKTLKYLFGILLAAALLSPLYLPQVMDNFQAREQSLNISDEENIEKQARYHEFNFTVASWKDGDLKHKLIGTDIFAAHQTFNLGRMLHTDYMTLLNGSGLVGLLFFIFLYLKTATDSTSNGLARYCFTAH